MSAQCTVLLLYRGRRESAEIFGGWNSLSDSASQSSDSDLGATKFDCVYLALRNFEKRPVVSCLSVLTKHLGCQWMDFHEIWYEDIPKICRKKNSLKQEAQWVLHTETYTHL
jgi:hypothetical protein